MFIRPHAAELGDFKPAFTILHAPDFRAIPLTVRLHGASFKLVDATAPKPEAPDVEAPPLAIAS